MIRLLVAVLAFAAPFSAHARIGETYEEIAKRFGEATPLKGESRLRIWTLANGQMYSATFDEANRSISETLASKDKPLTETQIQNFMNAQLAKGAEWKLQTINPDVTSLPAGGGRVAVNPAADIVYFSSDGLRYARLDKVNRRILLVVNLAGMNPGTGS